MSRFATTLFALCQFSGETSLLFSRFIQQRLGFFDQAGETAVLRDVNVSQQFAQLFAHNAIPSRLRSLPAKAVHLPLNFRNDVEMRLRFPRADSRRASAARWRTR